jgi:hypothetical protein
MIPPQATTEPHCSRGVQPGGICAYVAHREPTPGGPGSGLRRCRKRLLCQLPLCFYIYMLSPPGFILSKRSWSTDNMMRYKPRCASQAKALCRSLQKRKGRDYVSIFLSRGLRLISLVLPFPGAVQAALSILCFCLRSGRETGRDGCLAVQFCGL